MLGICLSFPSNSLLTIPVLFRLALIPVSFFYSTDLISSALRMFCSSLLNSWYASFESHHVSSYLFSCPSLFDKGIWNMNESRYWALMTLGWDFTVTSSWSLLWKSQLYHFNEKHAHTVLHFKFSKQLMVEFDIFTRLVVLSCSRVSSHSITIRKPTDLKSKGCGTGEYYSPQIIFNYKDKMV